MERKNKQVNKLQKEGRKGGREGEGGVKLAARVSPFLVLEPFLDTDLQGGGGVKTAARSSPFRT